MIPKEYQLSTAAKAEVAQFLSTHSGRELIERLRTLRTPITSDPFQAGRAAGWEDCIEHIYLLISTKLEGRKDEAIDAIDLKTHSDVFGKDVSMEID